MTLLTLASPRKSRLPSVSMSRLPASTLNRGVSTPVAVSSAVTRPVLLAS
jgi:hypothetical protein